MFFWLALLLGSHPLATSPWWVAAYSDGGVERAWVAQASGASLAPFAVWFVAPGSPPRRWVVGETPPVEPEREVGRLRVEFLETPESDDTFHVIVAPAAMWRDVPEPLLPRWRFGRTGQVELPRRPGEAWRLRVVGRGLASGWVEVAPDEARVQVPVFRAADVVLRLVSPEGEGVPKGEVVVRSVPAAGAGPGLVARFRAGPEGALLSALPETRQLSLSASAPNFLPKALSGRVEDLPRRLILERGASLRGRFVDDAELPVAEVRVIVEAWAPGSPFPYRGEARTDSNGRFRLETLPVGAASLGAGKPGFARHLAPLELPAEGLDLGTITLARGREILVHVLDEAGAPVPDARVALRGSEPRTSDPAGRVALAGLAAGRAVSLAVEAPGFVPHRQWVRPPLPEAVEVRLSGAFLVLGRYLDAADTGLPEAQLAILDGSRSDRRKLELDGAFVLTLEPGKPFELEFSSTASRPTKLTLEPGSAGEQRDLGVVRANRGRAVRGRLVGAEDGMPIVGGRLTAPRSGGPEATLDRLRGDLIETTSDADGAFRLDGLGPLGTTLRIEAPDRARVEWGLPAGEEGLDLGDVALGRGAEVLLVVLGLDVAETTARLDLGNRWAEADMLEAPLNDGQARFRHVRPGRATASVVQGRDLLCEVEVEVPAEGLVTARCEAEPLRVAGLVTVGGQPSGSGHLIWSPPAPDLPGLILRQRTPLGAERSEAFGAGRPEVATAVEPNGSYAAEDLRSGRWQVSFQSEQGWTTAALPTLLPTGEEHRVDFPFPGLGVAGRVVDEDGQPVVRARVSELRSGTVVLADAAGRFRLVGLAPGKALLKANAEGRASPAVAVLLTAEPPEPLTLVLGEPEEDRLTLVVLDAEGQTLSDALVFAEFEHRGIRILTTSHDGAVSLPVEPPYPAKLRVAALAGQAWSFGPWLAWNPASARPTTLEISAVGTLEIRAARTAGLLELVSDRGWNVTDLFRRAGLPMDVAPGQPLLVVGLPPGTYQVKLGESRQTVRVQADHVAAWEVE